MTQTPAPAALALEDAECPGCAARDEETVYEAHDLVYGVDPRPFPVVRCRRCGLTYLGRRPTRAAIAAAYPERYLWRLAATEPAGPDLEARLVAWWFRQLYDRRADLAMPLLPAAAPRVLELGCGAGHFLAALAARRPDGTYVGLDFEVPAAAPAGVVLRAGDVEVADLADEPPFDVVAMWHVLEHLHAPRRALAAAYERLAPGGWLVIGTQNFEALSRRLAGPGWGLNDVPRHLTHFSPDTLRPLVQAAGFEAIRVHAFTEMFPSLGHFLFPRAALHEDGRPAALTGIALGAAFAPLEVLATLAGQGCVFNMVARKPLG